MSLINKLEKNERFAFIGTPGSAETRWDGFA